MGPLDVARLPLQMPLQTNAGCPFCVCQLQRLCLACLVGITTLFPRPLPLALSHPSSAWLCSAVHHISPVPALASSLMWRPRTSWDLPSSRAVKFAVVYNGILTTEELERHVVFSTCSMSCTCYTLPCPCCGQANLKPSYGSYSKKPPKLLPALSSLVCQPFNLFCTAQAHAQGL